MSIWHCHFHGLSGPMPCCSRAERVGDQTLTMSGGGGRCFASLWRDEFTKDGGPCWICGEHEHDYEGSVGYGATREEAMAMFLRARLIRDGIPENALTVFTDVPIVTPSPARLSTEGTHL